MTDQKKTIKEIIFNINRKTLSIYLLAVFSSIITFIFFFVFKEIITEDKIVEEKKDIYEIAKKEAIKLGRLEPDEKEIVKEIKKNIKSENSEKDITFYSCSKKENV